MQIHSVSDANSRQKQGRQTEETQEISKKDFEPEDQITSQEIRQVTNYIRSNARRRTLSSGRSKGTKALRVGWLGRLTEIQMVRSRVVVEIRWKESSESKEVQTSPELSQMVRFQS